MTKTCFTTGTSLAAPIGQHGNEPFQTWNYLLEQDLRAADPEWIVRAFGVGGENTDQILARLGVAWRWDIPEMAVLYVGANDPGSVPSIGAAATQLNVEAMIEALQHGATGDGQFYGVHVDTVADLPANGSRGERWVVLSDTSTTGGVPATSAEQAATISGSVTGPTVWEYRYPRAGAAGWGRVAVRTTAPTVVKQIVVIGEGYLNYTTGGDTLTTAYALYAPVRAAEAAAVTAQAVTVGGKPTVVFLDYYTFLKNRIVAGTDPNFAVTTYDQNLSWHAADQNQHNSPYGHQLIQLAVRGAINTAGWTL